MSNELTLTYIGYVESPYKEKFAIPRQPGLVPSAKGKIVLEPPYNQSALVKGIEQFSHLWVIFNFHATQQQGWKPLVRPPRLGGNKKIGVLATRSTFRPNPIGMSAVKLDDVTHKNSTVELHISSFDLLDKTPILDIKPYIHYSDSINDANSGYATTTPEVNMNITFHNEVLNTITLLTNSDAKYNHLMTFITEVLQQDPRPAYKKNTQDNKCYGIRLYDLNIQWQMLNINTIEVINIEKAKKNDLTKKPITNSNCC